MLDAQLVAAAIESRAAWERVNPFLMPDDFTPQGAFWWKLIGEWYDRDRSSSSVDSVALRELGTTRIPNPKHRETILGFLQDLPAGVSPRNSSNVALELKRHNVGMELAAAIAASDDKKLRRLVPLYVELRSATELHSRRQVKYEHAAPVGELFDKVGSAQRIPLYPSSLNTRTNGGALPGHHIVIYGRPEIGKSTVVLNMACGFAIAGGERVAYIGNEDQINVLKARAVGRVCGMTSQEMEGRRDEAVRLYTERGGEDRLRFVQMFDGSPEDLRPLIEEFEPSILVVDQIRNVAGEASDGLTQRLEENGQAVRRLLLEYKLVGISVAQAGASAEGKAWLGMNDLDSSKTGLQGTADLLIGIGANAEMQARNQRGLSLSKNKLSSDPRAHEGILVDVDYARCSVK